MAKLLEKLSEYKPFAKSEELEENKREQEHPVARTSLKVRLAKKKVLVSDQGKDYEARDNKKKNQGEM